MRSKKEGEVKLRKMPDKSITEALRRSARKDASRVMLIYELEIQDSEHQARERIMKSQRLGFFCLGVLLGVLGTLGVTQ